MFEDEKSIKIELGLKEHRYKEIRDEVNSLADNLGKGVDSEIKDVVIAFRANGLFTNQSCQGHIFEDTKEKHGLLYPWVRIYAPEPDGWRDSDEKKKEWTIENNKQRVIVTNLLKRFYEERQVQSDASLILKDFGIYGAFMIQSKGSEEMKTLSLDEQKQKNRLYQKELNDFAEFLRKEYFNRDDL